MVSRNKTGSRIGNMIRIKAPLYMSKYTSTTDRPGSSKGFCVWRLIKSALEFRARCFSHGGLAGLSLSNAMLCPVRDSTHCCPSGSRNGIPVIKLTTPNSRPAKCSATDDDGGGWLGGVVTTSPNRFRSELPGDPSGAANRFSRLCPQGLRVMISTYGSLP